MAALTVPSRTLPEEQPEHLTPAEDYKHPANSPHKLTRSRRMRSAWHEVATVRPQPSECRLCTVHEVPSEIYVPQRICCSRNTSILSRTSHRSQLSGQETVRISHADVIDRTRSTHRFAGRPCSVGVGVSFYLGTCVQGEGWEGLTLLLQSLRLDEPQGCRQMHRIFVENSRMGESKGAWYVSS